MFMPFSVFACSLLTNAAFIPEPVFLGPLPAEDGGLGVAGTASSRRGVDNSSRRGADVSSRRDVPASSLEASGCEVAAAGTDMGRGGGVSASESKLTARGRATDLGRTGRGEAKEEEEEEGVLERVRGLVMGAEEEGVEGGGALLLSAL
mmetsp:Transcript_1495/g.3381  ORF Transcript_1495/g.3381 Transcript_1495/m.3381 type:complete len:149 (-) Transcript_1495:812-1258(-)